MLVPQDGQRSNMVPRPNTAKVPNAATDPKKRLTTQMTGTYAKIKSTPALYRGSVTRGPSFLE